MQTSFAKGGKARKKDGEKKHTFALPPVLKVRGVPRGVYTLTPIPTPSRVDSSARSLPF